MTDLRVMIHKGMCTSCKYFVGHSGCKPSKECRECENAVNGDCNCLFYTDYSEKTCPYYKEET